MITHEAGHVVGAWVTDGQITRVVLHPLAISRTDVNPNPRPAIVVWAGPGLGCLFPVLTWLVVQWFWPRAAYLVRCFAGFCLVTNGAYVGVGSLASVGDARVMLKTGSAPWAMWLFGMTACATGLWVWHGLGKQFGFSANGIRPPASHAWWCSGLLGTVVLLELLLS